MSQARSVLKLSFLDMPEEDSRPLRSAIGSCSSFLQAEFSWCEPQDADICIANVTGSSLPPEGAIVMLYARHQNGKAVDLVRPIRIGDLIKVFRVAMNELEQRQNEAQRAQSRARSYRGARIESPPVRTAETKAAVTADKPGPKSQRMYRGQPVLD